MLEPGIPQLRIRDCLADSLSVWAGNFPAVLLATLLACTLCIPFAPFLFVAGMTGLALAIHDGLNGDDIRLRRVLAPLRHPLRFLALNVLSFAVILTIVVLVVALLAAVVPSRDVPAVLSEDAGALRGALVRVVTPDVRAWLPAHQTPAPPRGIVWGLTCAILSLGIYVLAVGVRCFYVSVIAADEHLPLLDAYIQSRNAVNRYGVGRHALLCLLGLGIVVIPGLLFTDESPMRISVLIFLPLALGLVASAYRHTIGVERANRLLRERQFVEMRDELQTAHDMQMSLLPERSPDLRDYALDGMSVPANNVGGDYFAYRWLDDDRTRLAIVIADVSGKAMQAAVPALRFNEMLRYECRDRDRPGPILEGLNRALEGQIDEGTFITCCIAVLDTESGSVEIANAGHCCPLRFGPDRTSPETVDVVGVPLGLPAIIRPDAPYTSVSLTLSPGEGIVLYSDGVTEARNSAGEMYEDSRLHEIVQHLLPAGSATGAPAGAIYRSVERHTGNAPRADDVTVVVLERISPA